MREILDIILEEKFDLDRKKLLFSHDGEVIEKLEVRMLPEQVYEGSFLIHVPEEKYVYGYVSSSDSRMECVHNDFSGSAEIPFCFRGEHLEPDEVCRGTFFICSNQGEFQLPFEIHAYKEECISSEGTVRNLIQFGNLAKLDWQEAIRIFYSDSFETMIREKEPHIYLCYQGLSAVKRNEHNMDQFLIAAGKKQRMSYFVEDSLLTLKDPEEIAELSLGIMRNGWGYTHLDVEAEGDFLFLEKESITDDDFLGNRYKLPIYIDSQRLHVGRNLGRIILWDNDISVEVPVEVYCTGMELPDRENRRERLKNSIRLTEIYQSFRLKEINTANWLKETDQIVQRMMSLDEQDAAAKLFFAQILITAERYNEAGWILEHFYEGEKEISPELEAYYLYLSSLLRKDEEYTKTVAGKIRRIYKEQGESWRAAWLLLYVSKGYEMHVAARWAFLEEQFAHGCRSPIIYFEALQLLNRNPSLLRRLERFELQVLYYGNKKGILSPDLLEQVYYLTGKVKDFSPLLYRILERCYEKSGDERIVKEICTLLIKGGLVEKKYYRWFRLGIEAGIRITNLYEYYMMSLDLEKDEEIPKIVLLYFTYQNNMDDNRTAYLYSYVAEHREEYPEIYETYVHRIESFVKEQIQKGKINEKLDKLYHMFLTEEMVHEKNADAVLDVLFSYGMQIPGEKIRKAYVYQKGSPVPRVYSVMEKKAWIPIYSKESCVIWEDMEGNRFPAGGLTIVSQDLISHPIAEKASVYTKDNIYLDLYLNEVKEIVYDADTELLGRLFRLWKSEMVVPEIRRESAVRIMKYYYHMGDKVNLSAYLENLPISLLTRREVSEAIKYMVYCRMDDLAYEWMDVYSPVFVDSKISASLLSSIIKKHEYKEDAHLLCYAFSTFEKGKYTNEILRYLAMYYKGTAYDQYQIWKAALACGIETEALSERLLIQMLFSGDYVEEHGEVFRRYLREFPDAQLVEAYVVRRSYAYYLEGYTLDSTIAEYILQSYEKEISQPTVCWLACLKYYGQVDILQEESREILLKRLLKELMLSGIHLPWFWRYKNSGVDFSSMLDKVVLEYHAENDGPVKLRFLPAKGSGEEVIWKIVNMYPVCRRVFFTEHILFFGESLQYEILEEIDGMDVVVKSGVLKMEPEEIKDGRFGLINEILEAKALDQNKQFEMLLEDYLKKDFINQYLFKLM